MHSVLNAFHNICDLYNEGALNDTSEGEHLLRIYQDTAKQARLVISELYERVPCETTARYMLFAAIILVRLSYLIHEKRTETYLEKGKHLYKVSKKYGLNKYIFDVEVG